MIRRVLVFLLLFGSGLMALVQWFDVELPTAWGQPQPSLPERVVDGAVLTGEGFGTAVVLMSGATEFYSYAPVGDRGVPRYRLVAQDSEAGNDGSVILRDLVVDLFDIETGETTVRLRAAVGRTSLVNHETSVEPSFSDEITFEDVTIDLLRGTRLVPLELTSDLVEADLAKRTFRTPSRAVLSGNSLQAEGSALDLELDSGYLAFASDASCSIDAGERGRGRLVCSGPLVIRRIDEATEPEPRLKVVADRRAILVLGADDDHDSLSVEARRIELIGRAGKASDDGSDPAESMAFEELEAVGEATLRTLGHRFEGQRLTFGMTPEGDLLPARLEGGPEAYLAVQPPDGEAADPEQLRVWGESSMDLAWEPEIVVTVAGPAQMNWRETELWAAGGLSGSPSNGDRPASFRAWVGVEVTFANWSLETPELDGRIDGDRLTVTTLGESVIRGLTRAGEELTLVAFDALTIEAQEEDWSIPSAGRVALTLASDPPVAANADRIIDFRAEPLSFIAEQNVELTTGNEVLRGSRATVRSRDDLTIESDGEERVFYVSPQTEVLAHDLTLRTGRVIASGDVDASLTLDQLTGEISAERVEVLATLTGDGELEADKRTELSAIGNVVAELVEGEQRYDLAGDDLWLVREPLVAEDTALTRLRVIGSVRATLASSYGGFQLESDRLEGSVFGSGPELPSKGFEDDAQGELVAEGNVRLRRVDRVPFEARGGRLVLWQDGSGSLQPAPDGFVSADGSLPSTQRPFSLVAQSLDFAPEALSARLPEIVLEPVPGGEEGSPLDGLRANAINLVAEPGLLAFDGDVSFVGRMPSGSAWSLRSQSARFLSELEGPGDRQRLAKMEAEGDVGLTFADGPTASGDSLEVRTWSGIVTLRGRPAHVQQPSGVAIASPEIEFDPREYLVRTGRVIFGIPTNSTNGWDQP